MSDTERVCLAPCCCQILVRKPGETLPNFKKRVTCDRKCGANVNHKSPRQKIEFLRVLNPYDAASIKIYNKDTPGFKELAAQYGG